MAESVIKNFGADGIEWNSLTTKCLYAKKNGIVYVLFNGVANLTGGSWNTIGTLPQFYKPSQTLFQVCGDGGTDATLVEISSTGVIRAKPYASGTHYAYGILSFPT